MAGPSILVRLLGDVTGFANSVTSTASKGASAFGKLHSAFSSVLGQINSTGVLGPLGSELETVTSAIGKIAEHGKDVGTTLMGVGGAALGLGMALQEAGSKDQAAHQQLQAAIQATGHSYATYATQIDATVKKQESFGHTSATTQTAMRELTQALGTPKKALDEMGLAANLAAAKHETLAQAATQVGKAANGNARLLKEFGITATTASKTAAVAAQQHQQALTELSQKLSGQASASVNTFAGHMDTLKTKIEDQVATLGQKYGPDLTKAGAAMSGLGTVIKTTRAVMTLFKDTQILSTIATQASTAATWLWNAALEANPVLIVVLAIAALVAIVILIVTHLNTFKKVMDDVWHAVVAAWDFIKTAAKKVFDWIVSNWPLLLGILTGPFGLAVVEIIKHWGDIEKFFEDLPGNILKWLGDLGSLLLKAGEDLLNGLLAGIQIVANLLYQWFIGFPLMVLGWIGTLLGTLLGVGESLLRGLWNGLIIEGAAVTTFFTSLPGWILGWIGDLGGLLLGVGESIIGGLVSGIQAAALGIWGFFRTLPGTILGALGNAASWLLNVGKDIVTGLIKGIESMKTVLLAAVDKLIHTGPLGWIATHLGIHSPSTVYAKIGRTTMAGYVIGIQSMASQVTGAVSSVMGGVVPGTGSNTGVGGAGGFGIGGPLVHIAQATFHNGVDATLIAQQVQATLVGGVL